MSTAQAIYLNVGCGSVKLPGFINIDIDSGADLQLDIRDGLPFEDSSVHGIYSEHFIEHLTQAEILTFLRECRRVLAAGGIVRIATPDLNAIARQYIENDWQQPWLETYGYQWIRNRAEYLNVSLRHWGHAWVIDEEELTRLAELAGLTSPIRRAIGQSTDHALEGLETRIESTLIMEFGKRHQALADHPAVSIIIPAYKPDFFAASLDSALRQTYPYLEVLILDDSTGTEIEQYSKQIAAQDNRVSYLRNTPALGEPGNLTKGIRLAKGEFIKPLYDDDLLFPEAVAQLILAFRQAPDARLASGQRLPIDSAGTPLDKAILGPVLAIASGRLNGAEVIGQIAASGTNSLGEPTIMMFRRADALSIDEPNVMSLFGRLCCGLGDVCLASHLLSRGDLAYIAQPIAYFRLHADQAQRQPGFRETALATWTYFRQHAARLGLNPPRNPIRLNSRGELETRPHRFGTHVETGLDAEPSGFHSTVKVTAVFVSYEQKNLVHKALSSLVNQDYLIDEIIVSDDGSIDGTFETIKSMESILLSHCKKLVIRQNRQNLGIIPHFNLAFGLATNEFIVYFAGDDISEPCRIRRLVESYQAYGCPRYCLLHSDATMLGEDDTSREIFTPPVITDQLDLLGIAMSSRLHIGATAAFTRALWSDYGKFEQNWVYEDLVLGWRAAIHNQYHYIPEALVRYRTGGVSFQPASPINDRRRRLSVYRQRLTDTIAAEAADVRNDLEGIKTSLQERISSITKASALSECDQAYADWLTKRQFIPEDIGIIERSQGSIDNEAAQFQIFLRMPPGSEPLLADTLDSLNQQLISNWHLEIITQLPIPEGLDEMPCIGWHTVDKLEQTKEIINFLANTRISDWLIEIPVGAKLDPLFLWRLSRETSLSPKTNAFFVDDDCHDDAGKYYQPRFKPGVNPTTLLSSDLAGPLCVRREAWLETGGTNQSQGSPWFSKLLEITDKYGWNSVQHIPDVLISYPGTFPCHPESCLLALHDNMKNKSVAAEFLPATGQSWCIRYPLAATPLVTIAIISEGQLDLLSRCLTSIIKKTCYPGFEIIIALTAAQLDSDLQSELIQLEQRLSISIRTISTDAAGNLAKRCNAAVKAASNDFVLLINEGTVAIQENWLEELVRTCLQADIAAVSPRMIAPGTGLIENAGNVIGLNGTVSSPYQAKAKIQDSGYLDCLQIARDVSALSANCILIRVDDYAAVGGMDEVDLGDHLADADLCQKLLSRGKRLIYQPLSTIVDGHCSTVDLKINDECKVKSISAQAHATRTFSLRWLKSAEIDRFWNPNLSLEKSIPVPETDFRALWQYLPADTPRILARPLPNAQGAFRVTAPLNALRQAGLASECIWPMSESSRELTATELMRLSPDTLIVQHYLHDKHLAALEAWHSLPNRPLTVYAIDDLLTNMAESNHCLRNIPVNSRSRLQYALDRCDRMVASTDFLAETYRHFIRDIRVVPNRLRQEAWLPLQSQKRTANKPRIGWAGSATHQGDLVLLKEIIEQTRDEADWIFFGMCPDEIRPLLSEYHPFGPFPDYPARLAALNLDIAVAPLAEIPFNQGKSNLRLLEYGVLGIPVVCTNIDPYRPSPACCVENTPQAWVAALRDRIHDADAREREGATMRSWVRQHYLLEDHLDEWLQAHLPS